MLLLLALAAAHTPAQYFGALPDDGVPDNEAVQACLDASARDGLPCEVPVGRWDLATRSGQTSLGNPWRLMSVRLPSGSQLVGEDRAGSVLELWGDGRGADWWGLGCAWAEGVRIADLTISGAGRTTGLAEQQHLVQLYYGCKG